MNEQADWMQSITNKQAQAQGKRESEEQRKLSPTTGIDYCKCNPEGKQLRDIIDTDND